MDMDRWQHSQAYSDLMGFLVAMNEKVKGAKLGDDCHVSPVTEGLLKVLEKMDQWIDETPPIDQPQRFGNKAFRIWFAKLQENIEEELRNALPANFHRAVAEVSTYLVESVGNSTRIDYGTGHEAAFIMFLVCLYKIGVLEEGDSKATVLKIFVRYLDLVRKLQVTYRMEPAGSHGVWSLDDFQFVPFIWGSAQLVGHPSILPYHFTEPKQVDETSKDYMLMGCIQYINKVKTGLFAEHSNQLYHISGVASWSKVNSGFFKMYKVEVLSKFPVIQHVLFGSLITIDKATTPPPRI
ncbi:PREDICTED: serine/threonine-protein phosphatase 2A activator-like isoform X2 [Priapulus caudatus]|nr:PREDICTED: serine/threonine-protein phosphatase 2A activator-like isoform X2 [Priapulus caudatus]